MHLSYPYASALKQTFLQDNAMNEFSKQSVEILETCSRRQTSL